LGGYNKNSPHTRRKRYKILIMDKLLINIDNIREYYDMSNGHFLCYDTLRKTIGLYHKNSNQMMTGIYTENGRLFLMIRDRILEIGGDHKVAVEKLDDLNRKCLLFEHGKCIENFDYQAEDDHSQYPPFEYLDSENYDWGVLLSNIINNRQRRMEFIEQRNL